METKEFKIEGMSCGHCVMAVENALKKFNSQELNVEIGKVHIAIDETVANEKEIIKTIEDEGYKVVNN